jgi:hypothetical protein
MVASHRRAPRRRVVAWVVWGLVGVLLLSGAWILVRAMVARDQLLGAVPIAEKVRGAVLDGEADGVGASIGELRDRAALAASLTSDPIWRAAELVPVLGANLSAFRQSAALVHEVADDALPPLGELASTFTVESFSPKDGRVDIAAFEQAAPLVAQANSALADATAEAARIDTSGTVPQVGEAVDQLVDLVEQTQSLVGSLDTAVQLFPMMLGADGPRNYLLLSLNNAEVRATGGIPGALAVISADKGALSLGDTSSASALGEFDAPVLPVTDAEQQLYTELLATYMQDVNFTPDFARTGALAQAMWQQRTGEVVDGVIAIDPVALSYLLKATGPVDAGSGVSITSDNAVQTLLSDVYATFPEPKDQDAFFVGVTRSIFGSLTTGSFDKKQLIAGLSQAADERRIHIWSAHSQEQQLLAPSSLSGPLPTSVDGSSAFGVYLNDGTGAKMDYYLQAAIAIASGLCGADAQPNFDVQVKLQSVAPEDAATRLPEYVTGGGVFGVPPGNILTNVYVYAPDGTQPYAVTVDGQNLGFSTTEHDGHTVIAMRVELVPGQLIQLDFRLLGKAGAPATVSLEHTPLASDVPTSVDNFLDCPAPPAGNVTQS